MKLTEKQQQQLKEKRIAESELKRQLDRFSKGKIYVCLDRAATEGDGIIVFHEQDRRFYAELFENRVSDQQLMKFVPASGAASRMFKDLFEFLEMPDSHDLEFESLSPAVRQFALNLPDMPFFDTLHNLTNQRCVGLVYDTEPGTLRKYVGNLLNEHSMNYGSLPKALLEFHRYGDTTRMAFEEHLLEWALLIPEESGELNIHFTLSAHHIQPFNDALKKKLPYFHRRFKSNFNIEHSVQDSSTDTVAATVDNLPFTDSDGNLLFRPGGHGALLYNLNNIDADIIFIKNIDNVAKESVEIQNQIWKKILGGLIIEIKDKVHRYLNMIDDGAVDKEQMKEITDFIYDQFKTELNPVDDNISEMAHRFLNRPIRVCGMVKNTGEPGGGPFWVKQGGRISLQIIESAQINFNDSEQSRIANSATHFNPVDLVCAVRDYNGKKFDLNLFSDPDTSFISEKSYQGKVLKALEHPGLWNGAMAEWLTLFVEVPLLTFNPVKTVNDLLRPEHKSQDNIF